MNNLDLFGVGDGIGRGLPNGIKVLFSLPELYAQDEYF